jgi:hypothetical protein
LDQYTVIHIILITAIGYTNTLFIQKNYIQRLVYKSSPLSNNERLSLLF